MIRLEKFSDKQKSMSVIRCPLTRHHFEEVVKENISFEPPNEHEEEFRTCTIQFPEDSNTHWLVTKKEQLFEWEWISKYADTPKGISASVDELITDILGARDRFIRPL